MMVTPGHDIVPVSNPQAPKPNDLNRFDIQRLSDEQSERALLGGLLILGAAGRGIDGFRTISYLKATDFFFRANKFIYRAMERLVDRGIEIDFISVSKELEAATTEKINPLEAVGVGYLRQLVLSEGSNLPAYAEYIKAAALRRNIVHLADDLRALAYDPSIAPTHLPERINSLTNTALLDFQSLGNVQMISLAQGLTGYSEQVAEDVALGNVGYGVLTGYDQLDNLTGGFYRKDLIMFAGRPGFGKTALLLNFALAAMRKGERVLFITLEMPKEKLIERIVAIEARVDGLRLKKRTLNESELGRIAEATKRLNEYIASDQFIIVEMMFPTMADIRSTLFLQHWTVGFDIVFMDYAGLTMIAPEQQLDRQGRPSTKSIDPRLHMSNVAQGLKEFAKTFNVPYVTAAQLNRDTEKRRNPRPIVADLAESSSFEHTADLIGLLYRPDMYKRIPANQRIRAELIMAKQRNGEGGPQVIVELEYEKPYMKFLPWMGVSI